MIYAAASDNTCPSAIFSALKEEQILETQGGWIAEWPTSALTGVL